MPFANATDGTRLFFKAVGSGDPLLLVAGRNSDHHIWDMVRKDFIERYQVIVYDQRGTGQSDKPDTPPYSTRIFARDAVSILDHLHISHAHAYGVSMGGAICQWLGIDHSARFQTLVLACSTAGRSHGIPPSSETKAIMSGKDRAGGVSLLFSKPIGINQIRFSASMADSNKARMPAYAEELHKQASEQHDAWDLLSNITTPTLIIQGSDDPVCPGANASLLAGRIPGAELHFVDKGRHMFFVEFRQNVNKIVMDFLSGHPISKT
ncbi:MAG TPA: alpha/beta fold hydrolase [Anaerolineales bacterium]|nr:alpha/beta fold hydrolase [Anaerolineales bacterium]